MPNDQLKRILRKSPRRISRARLLSLLIALGVIDEREHVRKTEAASRRGKKLGHIESWGELELFGLYESSRDKWIAGLREHHPDRGGNLQRATDLNMIWQRLKFLFSRLGIPGQ
jgi:hypothetical protein